MGGLFSIARLLVVSGCLLSMHSVHANLWRIDFDSLPTSAAGGFMSGNEAYTATVDPLFDFGGGQWNISRPGINQSLVSADGAPDIDLVWPSSLASIYSAISPLLNAPIDSRIDSEGFAIGGGGMQSFSLRGLSPTTDYRLAFYGWDQDFDEFSDVEIFANDEALGSLSVVLSDPFVNLLIATATSDSLGEILLNFEMGGLSAVTGMQIAEVTVVPEPATYAMLGTFLLSAGIARRRRLAAQKAG